VILENGWRQLSLGDLVGKERLVAGVVGLRVCEGASEKIRDRDSKQGEANNHREEKPLTGISIDFREGKRSSGNSRGRART
jgi:hypothetical protein